MEYIKRVLSLLISQNCFDEYFVKFNFFDVPCFKATLSKVLGLCVITGSIMVKVPQILKLLKNKSGKGISVFSVTFDLCAVTIFVSYNYVSKYPISAWADVVFLAMQTLTIGILVLYFANETFKAILYLTAYIGLCTVLMGGITPLNVLWSLQGFNIPILLVGKMAQVYANYINSSTGQLSAVTVFMLLFNSSAKIFISLHETGDIMLLITYCAVTFGNAIIAAQMLFYWNADAKLKKNQKKVK